MNESKESDVMRDYTDAIKTGRFDHNHLFSSGGLHFVSKRYKRIALIPILISILMAFINYSDAKFTLGIKPYIVPAILFIVGVSVYILDAYTRQTVHVFSDGMVLEGTLQIENFKELDDLRPKIEHISWERIEFLDIRDNKLKYKATHIDDPDYGPIKFHDLFLISAYFEPKEARLFKHNFEKFRLVIPESVDLLA